MEVFYYILNLFPLIIAFKNGCHNIAILLRWRDFLRGAGWCPGINFDLKSYK